MTHVMEQLTIPGLEETAQGSADRERWERVKKWKSYPLKELTTKIGSGATPKGGDASYKTVGTPLIRSLNVRMGTFQVKDLAYIDEAQARKLDNVIVETGDVLFNITGASVARVCIVPPEIVPARVNQHVAIIRCKNSLSNQFLSYYLQSQNMQSLLWRIAEAGATRQAITKQQLEELEIPLPPLPEQQRIVARLDQAQQLIDQRKEQLALMDALVQSLFYEMFGDPVKNEKGWEAPALAKSVQKIQIGPFGSLLHQEDYVEGGIPLVNPMHIQGERIIADTAYSITQEKLDTLSLYILRENDIVMGRRGEMGRCAVVTENEDGFLCGTGSLYVRPDLSKMIPLYLWKVLSSDSMKKQLNDFSLGATMPNLNKGIMEKLTVPLPPLPLQQTFADRVQQIEALKQFMTASLRELEQHFQALMQDAFGG